MNAELELGFKLVVFLVASGLVLLELTKPKHKPRHRKPDVIIFMQADDVANHAKKKNRQRKWR